MRLPSWLSFSRPGSSRAASRRPRRHRPSLEALEDRMLPSNYYTPASVQDLIFDINSANQAGGDNTITLTDHTTFTLTAAALPVIAVNDNLTIVGNGDTIARSTAAGTPAFRLFEVA